MIVESTTANMSKEFSAREECNLQSRKRKLTAESKSRVEKSKDDFEHQPRFVEDIRRAETRKLAHNLQKADRAFEAVKRKHSRYANCCFNKEWLNKREKRLDARMVQIEKEHDDAVIFSRATFRLRDRETLLECANVAHNKAWDEVQDLIDTDFVLYMNKQACI